MDLTIGLPALVAGAALGILMFRRVEHAAFRRVTLAILFVGGVVLVV